MVSSGTSTAQPRWRTTLLTAAGYAIALGSMAWVFAGLNWLELWKDVRSARVEWLVVAGLFGLAPYVYNGWRWNLLLRPVARLKLWRTVRAFYIGLFANEVLPMRPGELISSYLLAAWNQMPFSVTVSSVALERLLDGLSLAIAFSIAAAILPLPDYLIAGVRLLAGLLLGASVLLLFLLWKKPNEAYLPSRLSRRLRPAMEGLRRMSNARTLLLSVAASFGNLALQVFPYWALNKAYRLNLSIAALTVVVLIVRTAVIVPTVPGNAGLLLAACVLGLSLFGIGKTRATGFVALLYLVTNVPLLIGGAAVTGWSGVGILKLRREMKGASSDNSRAS